MQKIGQYEIPAGYKRKPDIDRILFYLTFDPRVQRDYISFLQTEREFEIKYRNRYKELTETYKDGLPKDKDWAFSTNLYRAICERKSSPSYGVALKDYFLLCKLKEEYYDLEKFRGFPGSPQVLPSIPRSITAPSVAPSAVASAGPSVNPSNEPTLISKAPRETSLKSKKSVEQPPLVVPPPTASKKSSETRAAPSRESSLKPKSSWSQRSKSSKDSLPLSTRSNKFEYGIFGTLNKEDTVESAHHFTMSNKPVMKVLPVYNAQDQKSLVAQNKHLRDLLQTQTEEIMSLRNLDRENQDIVQNLKARLSSCTCDDNPESLDYTPNTSSPEVAQRFVNLYDNEYKIAIETLTTRQHNKLTEDVALYSIMEIIKRCYQLCISVAAEQIENMTSLMTDQIIQPCVTLLSTVQSKISAYDVQRLHDDAKRLSTLYSKRHCSITITNLNDKFTEELDKIPDYKDHLKNPEVSVFIQKCLETLWLMCNQQPPMSLQWPNQGDQYDSLLYKYYKGQGFTTNFAVWPAVLLHDDGPVLCKGFVVPL